MVSQILIQKKSNRIPIILLKPVDFHRYYIDRILFEMIKNARGRELAFINDNGAIRHIKAHAIHYLKENFEAFHFYDSPRNIYYSLAHLENMPMFSFVPQIRMVQQATFNENFMQYFKGLDFGMDFDEKCKFDESHSQCLKHNKMINKGICKLCSDYQTNWNTVYEDVAKTKYLFDDWGIPYQLKCSGSGFHINIEHKHFEKCEDVIGRIKRLKGLTGEDRVAFLRWFLCELSVINRSTSLDTSVIDLRRIWKMPYSIDIKTGNVALPLTNEQFEHFNWDIVRPENVVETAKNRGLLERPGNSENVVNFIENFMLG